MWYYAKDNQQLGPVSEEQLKSLILSAQLPRTALIWREGMVDWKAISDVPEMQNVAVIAAPSIPTPMVSAQNPYAAPRHSNAPQPTAYPAPYINSGGILAFAIVSVICCTPLGVVAIVYAANINTQIAAGDMVGAQNSARSSKMWSWISFGSSILGLIILALLGALGSM